MRVVLLAWETLRASAAVANGPCACGGQQEACLCVLVVSWEAVTNGGC